MIKKMVYNLKHLKELSLLDRFATIWLSLVFVFGLMFFGAVIATILLFILHDIFGAMALLFVCIIALTLYSIDRLGLSKPSW